jgi:tetratricopeptide (TPR) repeat protein
LQDWTTRIILIAVKRSRLTVLVAIIASLALLQGCSDEAAKDTGRVVSHLDAGASFLSQRLYEKAIEEFTLAIAIDPDCAEAYCDRGVSRYMTGEREEALRDFETAIEKDPTLGKAHFHRALLLDAAGATREAIGAYERFIRYSQRSPAVYVERANRRLRELKGNSLPSRD